MNVLVAEPHSPGMLIETEMKRGYVYLVDDQHARRAALRAALEQRDYELGEFVSAPAFLGAIDYARVPGRACVLTHLDMAPMTGVELLDVFRADRVTLPVVIIGATSQLRMAVKAMRYGGTYILWRPFEPSLLDEVVSNVLLEWYEAPGHGSVA